MSPGEGTGHPDDGTLDETVPVPWMDDAEDDVPARIGSFRIDHPLGSGGLGAVYAAWDETLEREVAIKVLHRSTTPGVRDALIEESRKVAALQHPAVVTVHSVAEDAQRTGMVMELVEGFPIDQATAGLTFKQRARLLADVARALAAGHAAGVIHRDLKPQNILVTPDLRPKLLDYGLALRGSQRAAAAGFQGSPLFTSPEQASEEPTITPAADVFSFGSVMFFVLTGQIAFKRDSLRDVLNAVRTEDPPFPRTLAPNIPRDLQSICMACMSRDPSRRPSAVELAADLDRFVAGEPARLRPALYGDILREKISAHEQDLRDWADQGIVSGVEHDRLRGVYRTILSDEEHWIFDARRLSFPQVLLYTGTWMAVVAAVLLPTMGWQDLSPAERLSYPLALTVLLGFFGCRAYRGRDLLASAAFFSGAILATAPALLSTLAESGALPPVDDVRQLLDPPLGNRQLLVAFSAALVLSVAALQVLKQSAFAWTTALLTVLCWVALLLTRDWLRLDLGEAAWQMAPLVLLAVPGAWFELRDRVRWAFPFYVISLLALVGCLDAMAVDGWHLKKLGLAFDWTGDALDFLGFAFNGAVFLAVMVAVERARSLDLRRGARILEIIVPAHLVGGLYAFAAEQGTLQSVLGYGAAIIGLLVIGPWRSRHRLLGGGLLGIALASHLVIDLDLADAVPYCLSLGVAGLVCAVISYRRLRR